MAHVKTLLQAPYLIFSLIFHNNILQRRKGVFNDNTDGFPLYFEDAISLVVPEVK